METGAFVARFAAVILQEAMLNRRILRVLVTAGFAVVPFGVHAPAAFAQTDSELRELYDHKEYARIEQYARQGDARAEAWDQDMQVTLAWRYLHGEGFPKNEREAFHWYLAAAKGGSSYAYLATAQMYAAGKGTERDLVEAYAQLEIALKVLSTSETQYLKEARALQDQLAQELSLDEIREAHRRARERRPDIVPR
jgi:TPR repeat protein